MATVDTTFSEKWAKEARLEYGQNQSKFVGKYQQFRGSGKTYHVDNFVNDDNPELSKARHADVTIAAQDTSETDITASVIYKAHVIDDWDRAHVDYDYRAVINTKLSAAVWRGFDDALIAALGATSSSEVVMPSANALTYAGAETLSKTLDQAEVPEGNRFMAISSGAKQDLRNDTTVINNFHASNNTVKSGMLIDVAGFDMFTTQRLANGAAGATERRVIAWDKTALGVFIPQDFRVTISWENRLQGYLYVASIVMGATVLEDAGVHFADITE